MRIVQLANFVSPTSGGIATTMTHLRLGYRSAGHDTALITPGSSTTRTEAATGTSVTIASPRLPRSGGYRLITDLRAVHRVLEDLQPDRIEVNDRFTLRSIGGWARARGVPSVMVVHERLDRLAELYVPWVARPAVWARRDNRTVADAFDSVVSPSAWGAQEFARAGVEGVHVVGWGVDLEGFHPARRSMVLRRRLLAGNTVLLAMACRLSPEKRPTRALAALAALRSRGVDARLVVAGTGAHERTVRRAASGLPVTFLGHLRGRHHVAEVLAAADVAICPGPLETFGLAALESLACGTPVVSSRSGAIPELLDAAYGRATYDRRELMATAVMDLVAAGDTARTAARVAALAHPWQRSVDSMLSLHDLPRQPQVSNP